VSRITGVAARVAGVYVQQKLFGIDYVLLTGLAEDGATVRERLAPRRSNRPDLPHV